MEPDRFGIFPIKKCVGVKNFIVGTAQKFYDSIKKIEIKISTGIIGLVITSVVLLGSVITVFDYRYNERSFAAASKQFLENTSQLTKIKIASYIKPFEDKLSFSTELIQFGLLTPENTERFGKYLLGMLKNNPGFVNVYAADSNGNLRLMSRTAKQNTYLMLSAIKESDGMLLTEELWDGDGKTLSRTKKTVDQPDPRLRPWYIGAVKKGGITWSSQYHFQPYSEYIFPILGVTASVPIYDKSKKKITGVFGIDMTLDDLSRSMKDMDLIQGTTVFIVKDHANLQKILYPYNEEKKVTFSLRNSTVKINDVNALHIEHSFEAFKKQNSHSFFYSIGENRYLAFYVPLKELFDSSWYAAIVIPTVGIDASLQRYNKTAVLSLALIILMVFVVVFIIGKRLTNPIKQTIAYAERVESLDFSQKLKITSKITEIKKIATIVELMSRILSSFSRYVPSYIIRDIVKTGDVSHIEGENKEISVLFVDICKFSAITESMRPTDLMMYLSEYFDKLTKVIYSKGGTLDKYIGDAIMCFWGAPFDDKRHALHACQCAMMFYDALKEINKTWKFRGLPQLTIRISVSTGAAVVGNVGSTYRLNYTALGDNINLASRLEALNKVYNTEILINETAHNAVKEQFMCRLVDRVSVRGQTKGVYIYEILRRDNPIISPEKLSDYNKDFFSAFKFYEVGDWEKAISLFSDMLQLYPLDTLLTLYIDRCKILLKEKAPGSWDGIWKFS